MNEERVESGYSKEWARVEKVSQNCSRVDNIVRVNKAKRCKSRTDRGVKRKRARGEGGGVGDKEEGKLCW